MSILGIDVRIESEVQEEFVPKNNSPQVYRHKKQTEALNNLPQSSSCQISDTCAIAYFDPPAPTEHI